MISFPNAKINIGLNVLRKREDGFHDIETIFYPLQWSDVLEIHESDKMSFRATGKEIDGSKDENICLKAYHLLAADFDLPAVDIHLHKVVPIGAGLGGGSSDASNTLLGLNQLFELHITNARMIGYASELGSDCTFFLSNKAAVGTSRGDQLKVIDLDLSTYSIITVYAGLHSATAGLFGEITPATPDDVLVTHILNSPPAEWRDVVKNDFEPLVFDKYPLLQEIKNILYDLGADYASMTGSGSAVYGIFKTINVDPSRIKDLPMEGWEIFIQEI
ncbi:MAG: 4-(cytidine 5'-diphospho)-2-C-methyl-D-erythritol kinase [Bacteroidetes bacterium]|nr:4-(cytidine 5'-diphospho)-2-C-methyl-D-erythritol kinase [Bacteroidota bacterium]